MEYHLSLLPRVVVRRGIRQYGIPFVFSFRYHVSSSLTNITLSSPITTTIQMRLWCVNRDGGNRVYTVQQRFLPSCSKLSRSLSVPPCRTPVKPPFHKTRIGVPKNPLVTTTTRVPLSLASESHQQSAEAGTAANRKSVLLF